MALIAEHARPFALETPLRFAPAPNPRNGYFKRSYRVTSRALEVDYVDLIGRKSGAGNWSSEVWAHYTATPGDPRYRELAERILDEELPAHLRKDPFARALAVSAWLSKVGTYSLKSRHAEAEDPTAHFLFGDRTGYCVHFAHAATYLMRTLGLPARVATGYAVEESARQGGSTLLLSGQDSHAWPEVYVEGAGWVIVDVTPRNVVDPPPPPPDPELQRLLGAMLRGDQAVDREGKVVQGSLTAKLRAFVMQSLWALLGLACAALFALTAIKIWRRSALLWAHPSSAARALYRANLDRLADVRLSRRYGEPRERFAARLYARFPAFEGLTRGHLAATFGSAQKVDIEDLRRLSAELRRELRRNVPWWKRWLGVLSPWTWLRAR